MMIICKTPITTHLALAPAARVIAGDGRGVGKRHVQALVHRLDRDDDNHDG
jgi:hypothetical protein